MCKRLMENKLEVQNFFFLEYSPNPLNFRILFHIQIPLSAQSFYTSVPHNTVH